MVMNLTELEEYASQLEDAIKKIALRGAREVEIGDKRVTFSSPAALRAELNAVSWKIRGMKMREAGKDPMIGDTRTQEFIPSR